MRDYLNRSPIRERNLESKKWGGRERYESGKGNIYGVNLQPKIWSRKKKTLIGRHREKK